jgi:exopolysaccharide biosynthesis polyprenyl glycosylphosphotransferase
VRGTGGLPFHGMAMKGRAVVELADDRVPSGLTQEGVWSEVEAGAVELVGESQNRPVVAPTSAIKAKSRPWPLILSVATFVVDMLAVTVSCLLAKSVAHAMAGTGFESISSVITSRILLTLPVWPVIFTIYGLYDLRRPTHATAELQRLFNGVLMSVLLVVMITFLASIDISRDFVALLAVFSLVTVVAGRLLTRRLSHMLNARSVTSQVTLIAGTNDEARALARTLQRRPWMGYRVNGFVEVTQSGLDVMDGLPVFGTIDNIAEISREHGVQSVIIAGSAAGGSTLQSIDSALATDVTVRVSPGLANLGAARIVLEPIDGMALFSLRRHRFSRRQRFVKRILDVSVTSVAVLVASPFMIAIALAIKITSPGPVLFKQRRVGAQEREFTILKFRTMVVGAHAQRDALSNEADGLLFKMRRDPRVTRVGRFLRKTSLDELPQLFNVLLGEMSLVGPRPALPEETARYAESQRGRLRVKPGVTGLWQVNGRHDLAFEDYVRYDLFYVENWSLTMDLYILAKTIPALLTARGSY